MTEIAFHFNAPDKLAYACRLLRKAVGQGVRVAVTADAALLRALDQSLWTFAPLEFIAHCTVLGQGTADPVMVQASPVVLVAEATLSPHQQVLVNLGGDVPPGFERFERVIEVVSQADQDRQDARQRWRHYADRGYAIQRHDLALKE